MWLHLIIGVSTLVIPSVSLTATSFLYATALCQKQDPMQTKDQPQQDQARLV